MNVERCFQVIGIVRGDSSSMALPRNGASHNHQTVNVQSVSVKLYAGKKVHELRDDV
jgi:hypothetical protein